MSLKGVFAEKIIYFILLPCIFISPIISQNVYRPEKTNDTLPSEYFLNPAEIIDHTYRLAPSTYRQGGIDHLTYIHATHLGSRIPSRISSGYCYYNWPELESYLNEILLKIIPEEFRNDSVLHAYILKDGDYNAHMYGSGQILINIGIFDGVRNEASLAYVVAHEFAHYYYNHSLQYYVSNETGEFKRLLFNNQKLSLKYNIEQERQADSFAMELLLRSGYDIKSILECISYLEINEQNMFMQMGAINSYVKNDHPEASERISMAKGFLAEHKDYKGMEYLVNEGDFNIFRNHARIEILKNLLQNFNYNTCIARSFKYHLLEPVNKEYVYFILEALRRNCYGFPSEWNKLFISSNFYVNAYGDSKSVLSVELEEPLLKKFDKVLLAMSDSDVASIKAPFYWDGDIRFKTNEQAFNYFYKLSQKLQCHECILTNALSFTRDTTARNNLLREYLKYDDIENRKYAELLLSESIWDSLPNKQLIVLNSVESIVRSGKEDLPICLDETDSVRAEQVLLDGIAQSIPEATILFLPDLKKYNMNMYKKLYEIMYYSSSYPLFSEEKVETHILFPEYYELFSFFGVNDIEFINCSYFEYRENAKTTDDFRKLSALKLNEILNAEYADKYVDIVISGLRIKKGRLPKFSYYSDSIHMKFKDQGFSSLLKALTYEYGQKCIKLKKIDFVN